MEQKYKTTIIISGFTFLLFTAIIYYEQDDKCYIQTCNNSMFFNLGQNFHIQFCLNRSTSALSKMLVYDRFSCERLSEFNLFDAYEITNALHSCFKTSTGCTTDLKIDSNDKCPYFKHINVIKF